MKGHGHPPPFTWTPLTVALVIVAVPALWAYERWLRWRQR